MASLYLAMSLLPIMHAGGLITRLAFSLVVYTWAYYLTTFPHKGDKLKLHQHILFIMLQLF